MGKDLGAVVNDALELGPIDRAKLVEEIYRSLETEEEGRGMDVWAAEAESRIDAYDRGEIKTRPYDEVRKSLDQ
jgi:putative addiction module component (TIGR02574 family)